MKAFVFAVAMLVAGVAAVPKSPESRFLDGVIAGVINDLSNKISERGLDPINIESKQFNYQLPVTSLLSVEAALENLVVEGLSNIVINNINFSILAMRLNIDVSLPKLSANLGSAAAQVILFNRDINGAASGSLAIEQPRVVGDVSISLGAGGVSVRSIDIDFSVANIQSDISLQLLGRDLSAPVNQILNEGLPSLLIDFASDLSELFAHIIQRIVENRL